MASVPVLMYHHVNPNRGDMVTVTPEVFEAQMGFIKEAGYRTLSLDELLAHIEGALVLNEKAVAITFDDGYLDNYVYAYPILKKYGLKAAIFLVTDWVENASIHEGKEEKLRAFTAPTHSQTKGLAEKGSFERVSIDWEMAREMAAGSLIDFHSHTMTHKSCDKLGGHELERELSGSKETLEKKLGKECAYLCWPKGRYSEQAVRVAKNSGYKALFTTVAGVVEAGNDPYSIRRIVVKDKAGWLKTRLRLYTNPLLAGIYLKMKKR